MKRHHKWFRKERYKQKLERDVDNHKTYFSNVYFTTDEPDPRDRREHTDYIYWFAERNNLSLEEAIEAYIERDKKILRATNLGTATVDLMKKNFPKIVDYKFTANMEHTSKLLSAE